LGQRASGVIEGDVISVDSRARVAVSRRRRAPFRSRFRGYGATRARRQPPWHVRGPARLADRDAKAASRRAPTPALPFPPGFVAANVSTIRSKMTDPVRRLALPNQPANELRARGFGDALAAARGKHLLIALRGNPDPDGIACALAQAHLGQRMGVAQTTIGYCHEVSHRENRALVKLLGLELRKIKSVREVGNVDFLGLVDAHEVLTIVDHHRPASPPKARFVDLRMDVGATSTIFVEYLMELAALDPDVEEDPRIATALMHGLSTDTDDFMLARAADFHAAEQIVEVCDRDLLQ